MRTLFVSVAIVVASIAVGIVGLGGLGLLLMPLLGDGGGHGLADLFYPVAGAFLGALGGLVAGIVLAVRRARSKRG